MAAATVWEEPAVHWKEQGEVQAAPSTVRDKPAGEEATVMPTGVEVKLAVTEAGPLRVRFCGVVVPERPPEKPENWYPEFALAFTETVEPALNQALAGEIVPPVERLAAVVRKNWVVKVAV